MCHVMFNIVRNRVSKIDTHGLFASFFYLVVGSLASPKSWLSLFRLLQQDEDLNLRISHMFYCCL